MTKIESIEVLRQANVFIATNIGMSLRECRFLQQARTQVR